MSWAECFLGFFYVVSWGVLVVSSIVLFHALFGWLVSTVCYSEFEELTKSVGLLKETQFRLIKTESELRSVLDTHGWDLSRLTAQTRELWDQRSDLIQRVYALEQQALEKKRSKK